MSTVETREEHFAAWLAEAKRENPTVGDSYWAAVERERRLQWKVDDLTKGVSFLAGYYGHRAETTGNADLAELVAKLDELREVAYQ